MNKFEYLKNLTGDIPHSSRFFYDHLIGTYELLVKMDEPEHICDAGLFHSIYYSHMLGGIEIPREDILDYIGDKAEYLVRSFTETDQCCRTNTLVGNINGYDDETYRDLMVIEFANLYEQAPYIPRLNATIPVIADLLSHLYAYNPYRHIKRFY